MRHFGLFLGILLGYFDFVHFQTLLGRVLELIIVITCLEELMPDLQDRIELLSICLLSSHSALISTLKRVEDARRDLFQFSLRNSDRFWIEIGLPGILVDMNKLWIM